VILAVVLPLSQGDPARAVGRQPDGDRVRAGVHLIGALKLGFVTELLSKPIRYGYMNGIALAVLIAQMPKLLGFKIESSGPLRDFSARSRQCWRARSTGPPSPSGRHAGRDPAAQAYKTASRAS
jgi:hypothetical protein